MIMAAAIVLALAVFVLIPIVLTSPRVWGTSPRLLAAGHLVTLLGWAFLPAGLLACAGLALAGLLTRSHSASDGCQLGDGWFGVQPGGWLLLGAGLALVMLLPPLWHGVRASSHARRTEMRGLALATAERCPLLGGGSVWVVAADEPLAYAGGVIRPRAVVTSALLSLLNSAERQAVLEHEGAHLRLGHPRLLLLGAAVARAYGFLPPVRRAWEGLRRELEAAADDEAARLVGTGPLVSALARVGLARMTNAASFGDSEHLRYRIRRLQHPCLPMAAMSVLVAAMVALLAGAFAWFACTVITPPPVLPGLLVCLGIFAVVGARPLWPWRL